MQDDNDEQLAIARLGKALAADQGRTVAGTFREGDDSQAVAPARVVARAFDAYRARDIRWSISNLFSSVGIPGMKNPETGDLQPGFLRLEGGITVAGETLNLSGQGISMSGPLRKR